MEDRSERERHLAAAVARRFYLEDVTKVDIAAELGISRFKVARLLELARDEGIVTITMNDSGIPDPRLSERLASELGLRACLVVSSQGSESERQGQVGEAAARYLEEQLTSEDVLGLSWGRTLAAMTSRFTRLDVRTIVQLTGVAGTVVTESPVEVVRRAALCTDGVAHAYFVPQLVRDEVTALSLAQQPDVAAAVRRFEEVTVAAVSVGSWDPPVSQIRDVLTEDERRLLLERGVQADVAGILIDGAGREVDEGFVARSLSIGSERLRRVGRVVAVAAGPAKARAVCAVARAGLMTELVTDRALAEALLEVLATRARSAEVAT